MPVASNIPGQDLIAGFLLEGGAYHPVDVAPRGHVHHSEDLRALVGAPLCLFGEEALNVFAFPPIALIPRFL